MAVFDIDKDLGSLQKTLSPQRVTDPWPNACDVYETDVTVNHIEKESYKEQTQLLLTLFLVYVLFALKQKKEGATFILLAHYPFIKSILKRRKHYSLYEETCTPCHLVNHRSAI